MLLQALSCGCGFAAATELGAMAATASIAAAASQPALRMREPRRIGRAEEVTFM